MAACGCRTEQPSFQVPSKFPGVGAVFPFQMPVTRPRRDALSSLGCLHTVQFGEKPRVV